MSATLAAEPGHINFSPVGFRMVAEDMLLSFEAFKLERFSIVPYFLCCRAIELALKAIHLESQTQAMVKREFWHDLMSSYAALPSVRQTLSPSERTLLASANDLYKAKKFEYIDPYEAGLGFSRFPDLEMLAKIARKFVGDCK